MLLNSSITAFVPTTRADRAREFYGDVLGLRLVSEDEYALEFESEGISLRVTLVGDFVPQPFAILSFKVQGIVAQVKSLVGRGLTMERYDTLDQDDLGIWTSPSGASIAWFKDPDGNLLSLAEYGHSQ